MQYLGLEDIKDIPLGYDGYAWMYETCFKGIDWCKEHHISYTIIARNWNTNGEIHTAIDYLDHVKGIVMHYAVSILNEYHHSKFDLDEWQILLERWIINYLASYYDKYVKLLTVEATGQQYECDIYDSSKMVIALDFMDYFTLLNGTDGFNLYQYSELYREQCHFKHIKVRQMRNYEREPIVNREKTPGYYGKIIYRSFIKGMKILTRLQDDIVFEDCYLPFDFLFDVMKKKPGKITHYVHDFLRFERTKMKTKLDYEWRNKNTPLPETEDEFALLMCKLLKRNLPIAYVEDFVFLEKRARNLYKFAKKPKAVFYSDSGISCNEVFKVYLMTVKQKGTIFCDIQHGGNYGIERTSIMQSEYELCDYFYTWGWRIEKDFPAKCVSMPAAKLLDKRLQHVEMGNDILYVSYTPSKRENVLYKRSLLYNDERQAEIKFLKGLSSPLREKMLVRLYPQDYGWHVRDSIDRYVSGVRYDKEKEYYTSLKRAKLVVLMMWSTTILEALYAGKPILVLHDTCHAEEDALEDIKELERVGVFVESWKELGNRLEEIYQNVDEWWNEPERQRVVQKIQNKYMYMPQNAKDVWIDEILSLAEGN